MQAARAPPRSNHSHAAQTAHPAHPQHSYHRPRVPMRPIDGLPISMKRPSGFSSPIPMGPALVAQGIEHGSPKAGVACSNHAGGTSGGVFSAVIAGAGYPMAYP